MVTPEGIEVLLKGASVLFDVIPAVIKQRLKVREEQLKAAEASASTTQPDISVAPAITSTGEFRSALALLPADSMRKLMEISIKNLQIRISDLVVRYREFQRLKADPMHAGFNDQANIDASLRKVADEIEEAAFELKLLLEQVSGRKIDPAE